MNLHILGTNHEMSALAIRERVAFVPQSIPKALESAYSTLCIDSMVILSTCNRTELIVMSDASSDADIQQRLARWFCEYQTIDFAWCDKYFFYYSGERAVEHLIRVASGLDSMILGEPQIFGQLKSAVAVTENYSGLSGPAAMLLQQVFAAAKKVRSDTAIGENPVSVAYVAVTLAKRIFSDLSQHSVLLIGAGETIELVARHLYENGVKTIVVANRTLLKAQTLADKFAGKAILFSEIYACLADVDVVVSSTASQLPILGKGAIENVLTLRKHKPLFMLDLAVPRDIEKQVAQLSDVYLYTIDDLSEIVKTNSQLRSRESGLAQEIIDVAVLDIYQKYRSLVAVDTLRAVRDQARDIRDKELQKALRQVENGMPVEEAMASLARSITNKLIHQPSVKLKQAGAEGRHDLLHWAKQLFGIHPEEDEL